MDRPLFIPKRPAHPALPFRERPKASDQHVCYMSERSSFEVYIARAALEKIYEQAESAKPDEIVGLLAGRIWQDVSGPFTVVLAAEIASYQYVEASPSRVKISGAGVNDVRQRIETTHWAMEVIGWYHSHPVYLAHYSSVDEAEQATWTDPNYIGIVVSCLPGEERFGVYRGPQGERLVRKPSTTRIVAEDFTNPVIQPQGAAVVTSPQETLLVVAAPAETTAQPQRQTTVIAAKTTPFKRSLNVVGSHLNLIVTVVLGLALLFIFWRSETRLAELLIENQKQFCLIEQQLSVARQDNQSEVGYLKAQMNRLLAQADSATAADNRKPAVRPPSNVAIKKPVLKKTVKGTTPGNSPRPDKPDGKKDANTKSSNEEAKKTHP